VLQDIKLADLVFMKKDFIEVVDEVKAQDVDLEGCLEKADYLVKLFFEALIKKV
jgi:hypothetical protein